MLVICATVVVFVLAHESKAKSYTATASVTFQSNTLSDSALNISTATSSEPQREADTEVLVAHSAEVAQAVRQQLKLPTSTSELLSDVKVEAAPTADVLNVIATTGNAQTSATLANAFASQYIAFRAKAQLAGIASAQAKIREQIAALPSTSPERVDARADARAARLIAGGRRERRQHHRARNPADRPQRRRHLRSRRDRHLWSAARSRSR